MAPSLYDLLSDETLATAPSLYDLLSVGNTNTHNYRIGVTSLLLNIHAEQSTVKPA